MKRYGTIVIDPPWAERGGGRIKRGADRHYPVLSFQQISDLIDGSGVFTPAQNCHLYLWVTNNFLKEGLELILHLGFRYITNLVWVKPSFGLGQYFRGQHELCLFAVRGDAMTTDRKTSTVIHAPKKEHSHKPDEFMRLVERNSPGPRLEMFARRKWQGWDAWGNEDIKETQMLPDQQESDDA